jgi:MazG family protein
MARLRGPEGCPWDREQTRESLKKYIIEEAYEVLEAIDRDDPEELAEELGDLLFQVVFQVRLADEMGLFSMDDVLEKIISKMKRRHPHVFGEAKVRDSREVLHNWELIKKDEKKDRRTIFDGIPVTQPSLRRASRIQQRAATVGFDWPKLGPVMEKFREEVLELEAAVSSGDMADISRELGDVLFSAVNVARHTGVEAEDSLKEAIGRFLGRFEKVEEALARDGRSLKESSLEEMDALWDAAKGEEKDV